MSTLSDHIFLDMQNEINDDLRHLKSLLFLVSSANQQVLPVDTIQDVAHFMAYRVEELESKFNRLCNTTQSKSDLPAETSSIIVESWEVL